MESNWAAEHLQVIRTLMERSALYRRALAPIMAFNGALGAVGAIAGWLLRLESPASFILFWMAICLLALISSYLLVRREALKTSEPFWSPPTRRITEALLPPLIAGCAITVAVLFALRRMPPELAQRVGLQWLPSGWVVLYGCALHAAGFFTSRGTKLFGWLLVLCGSALFALGIPGPLPRPEYAYGVMGIGFGALHLAYGVYLYFTEKQANAA